VKMRRASGKALKEWHRWLHESHGIEHWPDNSVFHYRAEPELNPFTFPRHPQPMLLVPLKQLNALTLRIDYLFDLVLLTFEPFPNVRTIAHLWPGPPGLDFYIGGQNDDEAITARLLKAFSEERLWWGTSSPVGRKSALSICHYFPANFPLPSQRVRRLVQATQPTNLATTLDLV